MWGHVADPRRIEKTVIELLRSELNAFDSGIQCVPLRPTEIDFEERVSLLCFHCRHYNSNFRCPPRIPALNYKRIVTEEYASALVVYTKMEFTESTYADVRHASTNKIHRALLRLEKALFEQNISTSLSLIGGSCKLCKNGCPADKCNNPYLSRMPMEAAGINVVTTVRKVGIEIVFPVKTSLHRCGLILW